MNAYELRGVRRMFGERAAVDGVDLTIEQGEFVAIAGPSGSGKSTLLGLLGTLDRGFSGSLSVLGQDVAKLDEKALGALRGQKLGFVFQSFHLLAHLSVIENVLAPALFADGADFTVAAERALDRVGLLNRQKDSPAHLSGGQRQRVALARALLRSPDVLLCDEPTGNLDTKTGGEIIALLASLNAEGRTVVVVTHEPRLAEAAKRRVALVDGKIAAS